MHDTNLFALFHLRPAPSLRRIDGEAMSLDAFKQVYIQIQRACHPDSFATASVEIREMASQKSAQMAGAYKVILSDLERVRHWLTLVGVDIEKTTAPDMDAFELQMSLNDGLEAVKQDRSAEVQLRQKLNGVREEALNWFESVYSSGEGIPSHDQCRLYFGKLALVSRLDIKLQDLDLV